MANRCIFNLVDDCYCKYSQAVATGRGLNLVTQAFYETYGDDYDFIFLLWECSPGSTEEAYFSDVWTPVCPGLGIDESRAYDGRAIYGSKSQLTGVVCLPLTAGLDAKPPSIHGTLLNNWGVYLKGVDHLGNWNAWGNSSANGARGGFDAKSLTDLKNQPIADPTSIPANTLFNVANYSPFGNDGKGYSPIELWLMGLLPKAEVPELYYMQPPLGYREFGPTATTMLCQGITRVGIDDIISANSGALPPSNQKAFRAAWVLVTAQPAAPELLAKADGYARRFGGLDPAGPATSWPSFAEATGGRASMDVSLRPRTPTVLNLTPSSSNRFVTATVSQDTLNGWLTGGYNRSSATVRPITKELYSRYQDNFDFIVFILDTDTVPENQPSGQIFPVSNKVQGIGKGAFDSSGVFGSAGRLKAHFTLWQRTFIEDGPFLHEFAHQWANDLFTTEIIDYKKLVGERDGRHSGGHWGYSGCGGQLGGFDQSTLQTNVDGQADKYQAQMTGYKVTDPWRSPFDGTANGGNRVPFSNLELYLMGMIPEDQLKPFDVFTGVSREDKDLHSGLQGRDIWNGKFHATTRTTYDRSSLVQLWGPRIPAAATERKDFQMLVVVLTTAQTLNPTTASTIDAGLERMSRQAESGTPNYNFWEATGNRGTMSFDLSKSAK